MLLKKQSFKKKPKKTLPLFALSRRDVFPPLKLQLSTVLLEPSMVKDQDLFGVFSTDCRMICGLSARDENVAQAT